MIPSIAPIAENPDSYNGFPFEMARFSPSFVNRNEKSSPDPMVTSSCMCTGILCLYSGFIAKKKPRSTPATAANTRQGAMIQIEYMEKSALIRCVASILEKRISTSAMIPVNKAIPFIQDTKMRWACLYS